MITLHQLTIKKTQELLLKKEMSAFDLTKEFFDYIEEKDKEIGAYLFCYKEEALRMANEIDRKIAKGEKISPLGGVPMAIKDNILVKNWPTTAGSKILKNYKASYDATVVKKLKKAGAIILGKTNLDEFAMGSSTENSAFQLTRNPLDLKRVPGGSSGGSAAAVASAQAVYALGSDTGGSVRQPAAFCGLVGLKPTYGAVSRFGLIAMASSLDQIGPITKNVEDAALVLEEIAGKDPFDATSEDFEFRAEEIYQLKNLKNLKIGIIKECEIEKLDKEFQELFQKSLKIFESLGAEIEEVSLPHITKSLACYYILMPAEVSSNLARYDGLRYSPSELSLPLTDLFFKQRGKNFGKEVKRRILLGTFVLSAGYYEAYYRQAQKVQKIIKKEFQKALENYQILLSPTTPSVAFYLGEKIQDPLAMYLSDIFTVSANIAGLPAISLPLWGKSSLPYGLQLTAQAFNEKILLAVAYLFEQASHYGRFL